MIGGMIGEGNGERKVVEWKNRRTERETLCEQIMMGRNVTP